MKSNLPLISIIVPIYNSEKYLKNCLNSLFKQSYQHIEIIMIDDGSTDKSSLIAETFSFRDRRFRLFRQHNSGVASARQNGLNHANGEYIIHCDSDDIMPTNSISELFNTIVANDSDMAVGSFIKRKNNNIEDDIVYEHTSTNADEFIRNIITGKYHAGLWNKLIKASLCKRITFPNNINFTEDKLYLIQVLLIKDIKISITNKPVYIYNHNPQSYTNDISLTSVLNYIEVSDRLSVLLQDRLDNETLYHLKNRTQAFVLTYSNLRPPKLKLQHILALKHDKILNKKQKTLIYLDYLGLFYFLQGMKKSYRFVMNY